MKKLFLIFALLFTTPSYAEWTKITENVDGNQFYVDFDRIRKHDGYIYFWWLTDYLKPKLGDLSGSAYIQGDCKLLRYEYLSFSFYKQPMGRGAADVQEPVKEQQGWKYSSPKSPAEYVLKEVCSR